MRRRATRLAAADLLLLQYDYLLARARQRIRDAEPRDARADHADVGREMLAERRAVGHGEGVVPDGVSSWHVGRWFVSSLVRGFVSRNAISPKRIAQSAQRKLQRTHHRAMLPSMSATSLLAVFMTGLV